MDVISHGEEGYATGDGAVLILDEELNGTPASAATPAVAAGHA
jgi:hypothetical protein